VKPNANPWKESKDLAQHPVTRAPILYSHNLKEEKEEEIGIGVSPVHPETHLRIYQVLLPLLLLSPSCDRNQ
jgi:hypothetical protein